MAAESVVRAVVEKVASRAARTESGSVDWSVDLRVDERVVLTAARWAVQKDNMMVGSLVVRMVPTLVLR